MNNGVSELLDLYDLPEPQEVMTATLPSMGGLYMFADENGTIEYVGKTINFRQRILGHEKRKPKHHIYVIPTGASSYLQSLIDSVEVAVIGLAQPVLNVKWNPRRGGQRYLRPLVHVTQTDPNFGTITWDRLVSLEPLLITLLQQAQAIQDDGTERAFCANAIWYQRRGLKEDLIRLVGWEATKHPMLKTEAAYDVAYETIYAELPACRNCLCF